MSRAPGTRVTHPGPTTRYDAFLANRTFSGLDALRAVSVLAVIWHHVGGSGPERLGELGVSFFFAISGFLITTLLLRERARMGRISLRKFYARRSLRIFPLYFAVLALYVVLTLVTRADTPEGQQFLRNLPAFATYTSNWFVGLDSGVTFYFAWSLATEEQFYLFWPPLLVLLLGLTRGRIGAPVAALATLVVASQAVGALGDDDLLLVRIVASLSMPILLGALMALVLDTRGGFAVVGDLMARRWAAPAVVTVLVAAILLPVPTAVVQVLMVVAVGTVVVREDTLLHPVLRWRPLVFVGVISYGVYMMHMLAANAVRPVLGHDVGVDVFLATVPLVLVMAYLSFRFFESPLLRIKARFEVRPGHNETTRLPHHHAATEPTVLDEQNARPADEPAEPATSPVQPSRPPAARA